MFDIITFIIIAIATYLFGSLLFGIILAKLFKLPDPRVVGSSNAGATNMLRIGNKKIAALTLILDIAKGAIPVIIAKYLDFNLTTTLLIGSLAILGHIFPIFFKFQGGKGVATIIGVLLAIDIYTAILFIATWLIIAKIFNISSVSSLIALMCCPIYFYIFKQNLHATVIMIIICLIIIIKHKDNICRLLDKQESSINLN